MDIFCHDFNNQTAEDRETLKAYFDGYEYRGAGYTYLANYIWRNSYCMRWEIIEDYMCIVGKSCMDEEANPVLSMPLTKDGTYDSDRLRRAILECMRRFEENGIPFCLSLIPGDMKVYLEKAFPGEIEFVHDRDYDEYVYEKNKLISMSGGALRKKRNHLNYFLRTYPYETTSLTSDMADEILAFTKNFDRMKEQIDIREKESLEAEYDAISEIMKLIGREDIYSTAIYIGDRLEAFAIGERLSADTVVEHFEKANDDYRGIYQVVCREFCLSLPEEIEYVNREEDMGLENLRIAKESLNPHHMEERYTGLLSIK